MIPYEERKAAVEYCIIHEKNYKLTAEYFGFTYQQIYGWVQRYQKAGLEQLPNFSGVRHEAAYQTVKALRDTHHWPVYKLCCAAGVSRAGYYKWLNRTASSKQLEDEKLAQLIVEIYQNQRRVPGYRQMQIILERRHGVKCNLKKVHRLIRQVCRARANAWTMLLWKASGAFCMTPMEFLVAKDK